MYSMDRSAVAPMRTRTSTVDRTLTPRTMRSNLANRMWGTESVHRQQSRSVNALHPHAVTAAGDKPILKSAAAYANELVEKASNASAHSWAGGRTPRSAMKARGERMEAGIQRWRARQAEYYGHSRQAVTPPPEHQPHGRPTHWLDFLHQDKDLGNKAARESVSAPDARSSTRRGVGRQRSPDGSFHVIRHIERGHGAYERFRRGVPPKFVPAPRSFAPTHLYTTKAVRHALLSCVSLRSVH